MVKIEQKYNIVIPNIYEKISRTGCMGCPYGSFKGNTKKELDLLPKRKRDFVISYFKESYDVLNIDYETDGSMETSDVQEYSKDLVGK